MHPAIPITLVFIGCCSNVVFLELIVREYPSSGNIITFFQFLFIALEGLLFHGHGVKAPVIPIKTYLVMVAIFFVVQVSNNLAFGFNIAMPLHMIFRSGSLIANLVLGVIILKRRYKLSKYLSVLLITSGIVMATLASASDVTGQGEHHTEESKLKEYGIWLTGIAILSFALFVSARMGIYQEVVYKEHGKHPGEALFYNHALPLPGFIFLYSDIMNHVALFNNSAPMVVPVIGITAPSQWIFLIGNVITQYICIKGVFILTTECTSLTVTLVVTLRKFTSLLFSILYFKNPFTVQHWVATACVFGGTLLFTETLTHIKNALFGSKKKVE